MPCEALAKQGSVATPPITPALMHYVYLLTNGAPAPKRYIGYTDDLRKRLHDHNAGKNVSTSANGPWTLRTYLAFSHKAQALAFEAYLKSGSGHAFAQRRFW
jgi:putative endonuclease